MIGITNAVSSIIGRITANYPVGSTCTCSNGTTTYTAPDTSGIATFNLREIGEWVVTCTDGSQTFSANVSITDWWQSKTVTLNSKLIFNGTVLATFSMIGGSLQSGSNYAVLDSLGNHSSLAYVKIDLTSYNTIVLKVSNGNTSFNSNWVPSIGVTEDVPTIDDASTHIDTYLLLNKISSGAVNFDATEITADVSNLSGEYYVFVAISGNTNYSGILNIIDFYIE